MNGYKSSLLAGLTTLAIILAAGYWVSLKIAATVPIEPPTAKMAVMAPDTKAIDERWLRMFGELVRPIGECFDTTTWLFSRPDRWGGEDRYAGLLLTNHCSQDFEGLITVRLRYYANGVRVGARSEYLAGIDKGETVLSSFYLISSWLAVDPEAVDEVRVVGVQAQ